MTTTNEDPFFSPDGHVLTQLEADVIRIVKRHAMESDLSIAGAVGVLVGRIQNNLLQRSPKE